MMFTALMSYVSAVMPSVHRRSLMATVLGVGLVLGGCAWMPATLKASTAGYHTVASATMDEEERTVHVYESVAPTVVMIRCMIDNKRSSGSGVIVTAKGMIVTARHVVGTNSVVNVSLADGRSFRATVLADDTSNDLALLQIEGGEQARFPFSPMGDSASLKVGQRVLAIGNPYGFERTLTLGIVSRIDTVRGRIQTDAAINPGNSGGPLLDRQGRVVGINQSLYNPERSSTNIGIGFAVPIDQAKRLIARQGSGATVASRTSGYGHSASGATGKASYSVEKPSVRITLHK
ncbi:MAG: S1C family serine protease [Vampirovibrionales bacterium]